MIDAKKINPQITKTLILLSAMAPRNTSSPSNNYSRFTVKQRTDYYIILYQQWIANEINPSGQKDKRIDKSGHHHHVLELEKHSSKFFKIVHQLCSFSGSSKILENGGVHHSSEQKFRLNACRVLWGW